MDDPVWENVSSPAKDLVKKLLVVDPESRITAKEIQEHPWIQFKNVKIKDNDMMKSMREMNSKRNLKPK